MLHCRSVPAAVLLYRMFTMTSDVSGRCLGVPAAGFGRSDGQPGGQGLRQLRHSIRHLIPTLARGSGQYSPSLDRGSGQYCIVHPSLEDQVSMAQPWLEDQVSIAHPCLEEQVSMAQPWLEDQVSIGTMAK